MTAYRFIEPLDVLYLRGNHLFGEDSALGRVVMPPWPTVFAGALRSRMLVDAGTEPSAYAEGRMPSEPYATVLGTPARPGTFALGAVLLARRNGDRLERFYPLPADVQLFELSKASEAQGGQWEKGQDGTLEIHRLQPARLDAALVCSGATAKLPVLCRAEAGKPASGYLLTEEGWRRYLVGDALAPAHFVKRNELWTLEERLGIALEIAERRTKKSALYTTETVALRPGVGFLVGVSGVDDALLPADGLLRLGGDGRAAAVSAAPQPTALEPDWARIRQTGAFRIVLLSPGLFPGGWRLPGLDADGRWRCQGATARLVCAAVGRAEVISGWDVATKRPKPAQRFVPTGAVYWLEEFEGDIAALRKLAKDGLWGLNDDNHDPQRRAEGFNRFAVANA